MEDLFVAIKLIGRISLFGVSQRGLIKFGTKRVIERRPGHTWQRAKLYKGELICHAIAGVFEAPFQGFGFIQSVIQGRRFALRLAVMRWPFRPLKEAANKRAAHKSTAAFADENEEYQY
ncbi:MAG TPA: hypothetical protein VGO67_22760 [Verrucomicrobiae bacterium]|jgi:hypothetical protein